MKFIKKNAFTLIELIIASTIFFIMVTASYIPYNYYMNKVKVKTTIKEISQTLYEARNMAINGTSSDSNISIGLYFDAENNTNEIYFISYPYNLPENQISNNFNISNIKIIKKFKLQPKMNITGVDGNKNGLFFFEAINGNGKYYYFDGSNRYNLLQSGNTNINITFSFDNALAGSPFSGNLTYFTQTNIVDY